MDFMPFAEGWIHFNYFGDSVKKKKYAKTRYLVWLDNFYFLILVYKVYTTCILYWIFLLV
jgi:hypothetical protein